MRIVFLSIFLCLTFYTIDSASSDEETVRGKIGIQIRSGDQVIRAKSRDRIVAGDLLRIYVHPEKTSHVYVIYTDYKTATLLTSVQQEIQSTALVMPSLQEYYQVDGKSSKESFTIICSPKKLHELIEVFKEGETAYSNWAGVEERLMASGRIELDESSERPFAIIGNVRGGGKLQNTDSFVKELQIFSGKSLLIKNYVFSVK